MDNKPGQRFPRPAKTIAIKQLNTSGTKEPNTSSTKKRNASTRKHSGRKPKARKTTPSAPSAPSAPSTPSAPLVPSASSAPLVPSTSSSSASSASTPHVEESADNVQPSVHRTPSTKRMATHNGLIETGDIIHAPDMETQITAEARGVTRKNIPWKTFRSTYLCDFSIKAQQNVTAGSVKKIGEGNWEEKQFWGRLRQTLSDEILSDLNLFYGGTKTLSDANKGKEVRTQPDFVLHVRKGSPTWANVELLFEHTRSQRAVNQKFPQWLRGAWSVFHHQPLRRHLYGIMFIQPYAYVCYADHGCAVYSEPLDFVKNNQHAQFLASFLTGFIANPERRGRDPTVTADKFDRVCIRHAETTWVEVSPKPLCYRPCLIGRNLRVAQVQDQKAKFPDKMVMKSTWEEKLPPATSPPSEVEVLKILLEANVRGLPQPYVLDSAIVKDGGGLEVETRSFPENCEVALSVSTTFMAKMQASCISHHTSKPLAPGANIGDPLLPRVRLRAQRRQFNEPLKVRRRLTRVLMSYCVPLKEAMRFGGPKRLMRTIRDAMIVYYEAYKLPESGFIHGDISIENILVPMEGCVLTKDLTNKHRTGTLIDWNLCFDAHGKSSSRAFRSGTPAFMAPVLLDDKQISQRTLGHDMESFFAVIIWIATFNYDDEAAFQAKPLAEFLLNEKTPPRHVANAKYRWFQNAMTFGEEIIEHFEPLYRKDIGFLTCLITLRRILYPILDLSRDLELNAYKDGGLDKNDNNVTEEADPMKEGLFQQCMKEIDDYLGETKGCDEIEQIGRWRAAKGTDGKGA